MTGWSVRWHLWLGALTSLLLVLGFGGWAATARLSGAVIAPAQVEVERNRQVIQHPQGGVVAEILVHEGQRVAAGAPLLRLDGTLLEAELALVSDQYFQALARHARLVAERDGLPTPRFAPELAQSPPHIEAEYRLFHARAQALGQQVAQLEHRRAQALAEGTAIAAQTASLERERALQQAELSRQELAVQQGLVESARLLPLRREQARLQGTAAALQAQAAQIGDRSAEIGLQILAARSAHRSAAERDLLDTGARLLELAQRRIALGELRARLELSAPLAGVVHDLAITTPRAVLRAAEPAMELVPLERALVLRARIAPQDIDQLHLGQSAQIRFPGLGQGGEGWQGRLMHLSGDAFTDPRHGQSYYRAEVVLSTPAPDILPGMLAEVFFATTETRVIDYLIRPFSDHLRRALREG